MKASILSKTKSLELSNFPKIDDMSCNNLLDLPVGCLSHILSLTSPRDVVRSSAVSTDFLSASKSDAIWNNFLPSDCDYFLSQSSIPIDQQQFASKKDLFFSLCQFPILFDNKTQSFALDKSSGKKCYMLGARMLMIAWGETPAYWSWRFIPESRFPETAQLNSVCWFDIKGRLPIKFLSADTTYGAYFVFQKVVHSFAGFYGPVKASVLESDQEGLSKSYEDHRLVANHYFIGDQDFDEPTCWLDADELPVERGDGWMEIEMGRYHVGSGVEAFDERVVLEMALMEVEDLSWKSGLLVQGIELRPLD
ncbi:putative F-box protein PP2-B12 [Chenopodium quinoa]|uniref:putative F-box protein PP2-B12 n=1 Tax=Chenopodium quinoa TaxID=63459 RepID=UPI000B797380|nr:putative F-box protein PP2-B12 [Chenopodium quinoa]